MSFYRPRNRILEGLMAIAILFGGAEAMAQKSVGTLPSPPPGTIYFLRLGTGDQGCMKGDGSGVAASVTGQPSFQRHNGSRWFLQSRAIGQTGVEQWFGVNEAGNAVQLTNDPAGHNGYPPVWAKNDSFFSFTAFAATASEYVGSVYVVQIAWTNGVPVAGTPTAVYEIRRPLWDDFWGVSGDYEADLARHDWSPAGDQLALTRWVWGEGWVIDVATYSVVGMTSLGLTYGQNPAWSPDGSRIAFNRILQVGYHDNADIWTINPNATSAKQLTQYIAGKGYDGTTQLLPTWSPDGVDLAFTQKVISGNKTIFNIRRVAAVGGTVTSLTTNGASSLPRWRP